MHSCVSIFKLRTSFFLASVFLALFGLNAQADCPGSLLCTSYDYNLPVNIVSPSGPAFTVMGGNVGFGTTTPAQPLSVAGIIESTTGGFKFPDGTVQTTAATGSGSSTSNLVYLTSIVNLPLTGSVPLTIDGVTIALGSTPMIFLRSQTNPAESGIYAYSDNGSTYTLTLNPSYTNHVAQTFFVTDGVRFAGTTWAVSAIAGGVTSFVGQGYSTGHWPNGISPYDTTGTINIGLPAHPFGSANSKSFEAIYNNQSLGSLSASSAGLNLSAAAGSDLNLNTRAETGTLASGQITITTGNTVNGDSGGILIATAPPAGSGTRGVILIDGPIAINTFTGTGTNTSSLGANNSPGAATPAGWIQVLINGQVHYMPYF